MDAEKLIQAFSADEVREVASALPDDVLQSEVIRRGLEISSDVGAAATQAVTEVEPTAEDEFETALADFLNPEVAMTHYEQLAVMHRFWKTLGFEVPRLDTDQLAKLDCATAKSVGGRVVPTPLLTVWGRQDIVEGAKRVFGKNQLDDETLRMDEASAQYRVLLYNPQGTIKEDMASYIRRFHSPEEPLAAYVLRYRTPEGRLADRAAYIEALKEAGRTIQDNEGFQWTFPIIDVRVRSQRSSEYVEDLLQAANPLMSPEVLLTTQLLHQANGSPNPEWEVDIANEAVYRLDENGSSGALVSVASVVWEPDCRAISLIDRDARQKFESFGVRHMTIGL